MKAIIHKIPPGPDNRDHPDWEKVNWKNFTINLGYDEDENTIVVELDVPYAGPNALAQLLVERLTD